MKKKVLIVLTSHDKLGKTGNHTGYYLPEVTHPYFKFIEAGIEVDFASPKGGKAPMEIASRDLSDPYNKRFLDDKKLVHRVEHTIPLEDINPDEYSAIMFAGGHGTMWDFPNSKEVSRLSSLIYEKGGVVAAVCHGPAALINVKLPGGQYLVEGKKVTGFSNEEEDAVQMTGKMPFLIETSLRERGAQYEKADLWQNKVVVDGRLVTGQNPASASALGEAVVNLINH